jgi:hippurate hydrolase
MPAVELLAALVLSAIPHPALPPLDQVYPSLDALYLDLHRNPELSTQEKETSARLAARLAALGFEVTTGVGGYGVVGVLRNGPGPVVLVRTDMDALPVKEVTGLPYASTATARNGAGEIVPVMHACGHDIHMASWVGAATLLAGSREHWRGTLVFVGQPAEESVNGAMAMVKDGLFTRFPRPDFAIALHDTQMLPSGTVGLLSGPAWAASNAVDITFHGKGGHGAAPQLTVDPVLMAARAVVTLQSIVSREVNPLDPAVVTVGTFHAGTKRNVIPADATIQLTVRSYKREVQRHLLEAITRIARAEAAAANAPREPTVTVDANEVSEVVVNDPALVERLGRALRRELGEARVRIAEPVASSEDFGVFGREAGIPSAELRLGASDPVVFEEARRAGTFPPGPHNGAFAPDREPTIRTGASLLTISALELLGTP